MIKPPPSAFHSRKQIDDSDDDDHDMLRTDDGVYEEIKKDDNKKRKSVGPAIKQIVKLKNPMKKITPNVNINNKKPKYAINNEESDEEIE